MSLHNEISKIAYELYERSGRADGRDLDNWFEAEKIVKKAKQEVFAPEKPLRKNGGRNGNTKKAKGPRSS